MSSMSERIAFATDGFAVVVCRHPDGRFLGDVLLFVLNGSV